MAVNEDESMFLGTRTFRYSGHQLRLQFGFESSFSRVVLSRGKLDFTREQSNRTIGTRRLAGIQNRAPFRLAAEQIGFQYGDITPGKDKFNHRAGLSRCMMTLKNVTNESEFGFQL